MHPQAHFRAALALDAWWSSLASGGGGASSGRGGGGVEPRQLAAGAEWAMRRSNELTPDLAADGAERMMRQLQSRVAPTRGEAGAGAGGAEGGREGLLRALAACEGLPPESLAIAGGRQGAEGEGVEAAIGAAAGAKERGNEHFKAGDMRGALAEYSDALSALRGSRSGADGGGPAKVAATLLANRSACGLQLATGSEGSHAGSSSSEGGSRGGDAWPPLQRALLDGQAAAMLEGAHPKAHVRCARALKALGWMAEAEAACRRGLAVLEPVAAGAAGGLATGDAAAAEAGCEALQGLARQAVAARAARDAALEAMLSAGVGAAERKEARKEARKTGRAGAASSSAPSPGGPSGSSGRSGSTLDGDGGPSGSGPEGSGSNGASGRQKPKKGKEPRKESRKGKKEPKRFATERETGEAVGEAEASDVQEVALMNRVRPRGGDRGWGKPGRPPAHPGVCVYRSLYPPADACTRHALCRPHAQHSHARCGPCHPPPVTRSTHPPIHPIHHPPASDMRLLPVATHPTRSTWRPTRPTIHLTRPARASTGTRPDAGYGGAQCKARAGLVAEGILVPGSTGPLLDARVPPFHEEFRREGRRVLCRVPCAACCAPHAARALYACSDACLTRVLVCFSEVR